MVVYIIYEHVVREIEATIALQIRLEQNGEDVKLFSMHFGLLKMIHAATISKPDIIVVPGLKSGKVLSALAIVQKMNKNVKVVNIHHEQISSLSMEKVLIPTEEFDKFAAYHFVWADYFYRRLIDHGVPRSKIIVTGNIRNALATEFELIPREDLSAKFGLNCNKKWIFFAENRGWISQQQRDLVNKVYKRIGWSPSMIDECIEEEKFSLKMLFDEFDDFGDEFFEKYEFIYRPHPATQFGREINSRIRVINDLSIYHWIKASDAYITCESTSIFEAEMLRKPCFWHNKHQRPTEHIMSGIHDYPELKELTDISIELANWKPSIHSHSIYKNYLGKQDGLQIEKTVEALYTVYYDTQNNIQKASGALKILDRLLKIAIIEVLTYLEVKINLVDKLKWPNLVYKLRNDIPYTEKNLSLYAEIRGRIERTSKGKDH